MRAVVFVAFSLIAAQGGYAIATGDGLEMTLTVVVAALLVKSNFGFTFEPVACPRCRVPVPRWRKPRNAQQFLWGGHTCHNCGLNIDKWGRPLAARWDQGFTPAHTPASTRLRSGGRSSAARYSSVARRAPWWLP
jgi:hypothetical protein